MGRITISPAVRHSGLRGLCHHPRVQVRMIWDEFEDVINTLDAAGFKHHLHSARQGILRIDTVYKGKRVKFYMTPDPSGDGFAGTIMAQVPKWRSIGLLIVQQCQVILLSDYTDAVPTATFKYRR